MKPIGVIVQKKPTQFRRRSEIPNAGGSCARYLTHMSIWRGLRTSSIRLPRRSIRHRRKFPANTESGRNGQANSRRARSVACPYTYRCISLEHRPITRYARSTNIVSHKIARMIPRSAGARTPSGWLEARRRIFTSAAPVGWGGGCALRAGALHV